MRRRLVRCPNPIDRVHRLGFRSPTPPRAYAGNAAVLEGLDALRDSVCLARLGRLHISWQWALVLFVYPNRITGNIIDGCRI